MMASGKDVQVLYRSSVGKFGDKGAHAETSEKLAAFVVLDAIGREHNAINRRFAEDLGAAVAEVREGAVNGRVAVVVFVSAKKDSFVVGADIEDEICTYRDASVAARDSQALQGLFTAIECLPIATIAVLWGHCLGGGFELALACDYRLYVDGAPCTVGLPEVKIGLIPGAGGCVRLTRLIGLSKALPLILRGASLDAAAAARGRILSGVIGVSLNGSASFRDLVADSGRDSLIGALYGPLSIMWSQKRFNAPLDTGAKFKREEGPLRWWIGRQLLYFVARTQLSRASIHPFPAPYHALYACVVGAAASIESALAVEAAQFGCVAVTPEAKSLMTLFRAGSSTRRRALAGDSSISARSAGSREVQTEKDGIATGDWMTAHGIVIVGAARPSASLAQSYIKAGIRVHVVDANEESLRTLLGDVTKMLSTNVRGGEGGSDKMKLLSTGTSLDCPFVKTAKFAIVNSRRLAWPLPSNGSSEIDVHSLQLGRRSTKAPSAVDFHAMSGDAAADSAVVATHATLAALDGSRDCAVAVNMSGWSASHMSRAVARASDALASLGGHVPSSAGPRKQHAVCGINIASVASVTRPGVIAPPAACAELYPFEASDVSAVRRCAVAVSRGGRTPVLAAGPHGHIVDHLVRAWFSVASALLFDGNCTIGFVERCARDFGFVSGPLGLIDRMGLRECLTGGLGAWSRARRTGETSPGQLGGADIDEDLLCGALEVLAGGGHDGCDPVTGSGCGFLRYAGARVVGVNPAAVTAVAVAARERECRRLTPLRQWSLLRWGIVSSAEVVDALVLSLSNEACRLAASTGIPVEEIDLLCVLALGFLAHHGGPISYADRRGCASCVRALAGVSSRLRLAEGPLTPCPAFVRAASSSSRFYPLIPPETAGGLKSGAVPWMLPMGRVGTVVTCTFFIALFLFAMMTATEYQLVR